MNQWTLEILVASMKSCEQVWWWWRRNVASMLLKLYHPISPDKELPASPVLLHLWKDTRQSPLSTCYILQGIFRSMEKISARFAVSMVLHSRKLIDSSESKSNWSQNTRLLSKYSHLWNNTWSTETYGSCIKYMESSWIMKTLKRSSV